MKILIGLFVIVVILMLATIVVSEFKSRQSTRLFPPEGQFVNVNGTPIHYVEQGSGPAVVLIHGASGNTRDFTFDLMRRLSDRYRVIAFDRPGLGHSAALPDATIEAQATILAEAARQLGTEAPIVLGQSYGAAVALAWALKRPDNIGALVIVSGVSHTWKEPLSPFYRRLSHPFLGPILARLISAWAPQAYVEQTLDSIFEPQQAPEGYLDNIGVPLVLRPSQLLENAKQRAGLLDEIIPLVPRYPRMTLPVEIVHGERDLIVGFERHAVALSRDVPGAHLVGLNGVGHMPHHSHPKEIVAAIDRAATRSGLN